MFSLSTYKAFSYIHQNGDEYLVKDQSRCHTLGLKLICTFLFADSLSRNFSLETNMHAFGCLHEVFRLCHVQLRTCQVFWSLHDWVIITKDVTSHHFVKQKKKKYESPDFESHADL